MAKKRINISPKKTPKVNPFIQAPLVEGNTPQGFLFDWVNSDEYKKRLKANGYNNPDELIGNRLRNLENSNISYSNAVSVASPGSKNYLPNNVNINKQDTTQYGNNVVVPHELSHLIGANYLSQYDTSMNNTEKSILDNANINRASDQTGMSTEMKADLDSNRFNLYNNQIYDIKDGTPFTIDHLNKAKESLKDDVTFNRLIEQTGDDNYIQLMNGIASNNTQPVQQQAKYGGMLNKKKQYNPLLDEYFLGGTMNAQTGNYIQAGASMASQVVPEVNKKGNTSVGGSTLKGAASGAALGTTILPGWGTAIGAVVGGAAGFIKGKSGQRKEEEAYDLQMEKATANSLASMNYGIGNGSNLPMAMGGAVNPVTSEIPIGSYNHFPVGGTHESNPYGGIPQGTNSQGQQMTTEEGEGSFRFKDGKYIFSNRLILE